MDENGLNIYENGRIDRKQLDKLFLITRKFEMVINIPLTLADHHKAKNVGIYIFFPIRFTNKRFKVHLI